MNHSTRLLPHTHNPPPIGTFQSWVCQNLTTLYQHTSKIHTQTPQIIFMSPGLCNAPTHDSHSVLHLFSSLPPLPVSLFVKYRSAHQNESLHSIGPNFLARLYVYHQQLTIAVDGWIPYRIVNPHFIASLRFPNTSLLNIGIYSIITHT